MTHDLDQPTGLWIARRRCGCIVAALHADRMARDDVAEMIGGWILGGLAVERSGERQVTIAMGECEHAQSEPAAKEDFLW